MPKEGINNQHKPAVMVTGCPRSGSTILARILALSAHAGYLEEPLNHQTGIIGTDEPFVYLYEGSPHTATYDAIINDILSGQAQYKTSYFQPQTLDPARWIFYKLFTNRYQFRYGLGFLSPWTRIYITKDPTASFAAEYIHDKFDFKVIITVRHPCAVVASHKRLNWVSPIAMFLQRPDLRQLFSKELQAIEPGKLTPAEQLAWYWRAVYEVLTEVAKRHPDMTIVEHEYFSRQPLEVTKKLYDKINLPLTIHVKHNVKWLTGAGNATDPGDKVHELKRNSIANIDRWKKLLGKAESDRIMSITQNTYEKFLKLPNNLSPDVPSASKRRKK